VEDGAVKRVGRVWSGARCCSMRLLPLALTVLVALTGAARPKTGRDWSKLSDEDWQRIESEWETPEEKEEYEFKPPKQKGIDMDALKKTKSAKAREKLVEESQVSDGPQMMFATLDYPGCCEKKKTEEIATKWAGMLRTSGMDISTYVIEDDQVLFSTQAGLHASEIRDYVVQQPECVAVEWNQKRKPGPAETPEWTAKNEVKKAEKEKAKKEKEAAEAAVKKAEERTEKKKKKAKKAAKAKAEL